MEGVSHEAASIAGHQKLDNLCWIYDNNHITIDGHTEITYEDDVSARFEGYGWNVDPGRRRQRPRAADRRAFEHFKARADRPTLIIVDSHIGYGSPHKVDTAEVHGEPLGEEEVQRDEEGLRLARGRRSSSSPTASPSTSPKGSASAAPSCAPSGRSCSRPTRGTSPTLAARDRGDAAARASRRLGRRDPQLRCRREGDGHPQGLEPGRERGRGEGPLAARRLGRPHRLDLGRARGRRPTSSPRTAAGASSTSASASTSRRRSPTGSRCRSCGRSGPPTSPSPTTPSPRSGSAR